MYDFVIIGSGLFGATCAHELRKIGKKVWVVEQRKHIGGNVFSEEIEGIQVHKYGAHIFHTNSKMIWDYVNSLVEFNRFTNSPLVKCGDRFFNLPFNMNTFYQLWGVKTPAEAMTKIESQRAELLGKEPKNLEEQAISLVGRDIYEMLIKGYTEKQWGRKATQLPPFIIKRLPVRFTFDNNYFSDLYQGVPIGGYTRLVEKMLSGVSIDLGVDYLADREKINSMAKNVIYTGAIDRYFDYQIGTLEYRSLRFETDVVDSPNVQGNAVINYADSDVEYTRIIEHKHFDWVDVPKSVITREYPIEWNIDREAYYPINNEKNTNKFTQYRELAKAEKNVFFGGRLAEYRYYDMHQVIASALNALKKSIVV
jgi:UDP-galactopyranose mutase